jgi:hypothetical protein
LPAPLDRDIFYNWTIDKFSIDLLVEWKDYARVKALFAKRLGECAGNVSESARFGKRYNLRGKNGYTHQVKVEL